MFTEIKKLNDSKRFLKSVYEKNCDLCSGNDKEYLDSKYAHSYDSLAILKKLIPEKYLKYSSSILLHDVGRFFEHKKYKHFEHAEFGYNYLKENFTNDPLVLLPVKYHEKDLKWIQELYSDKNFLKYNQLLKLKITKCCSLVRDIDVISNMKLTLKNIKNEKPTIVDNHLVNALKNGNIADNEYTENRYNQIVYILCGLSIINNEISFKYLEKNQVVKGLVSNLFSLIGEDKKLYELTLKVEDIIYEKYNL